MVASDSVGLDDTTRCGIGSILKDFLSRVNVSLDAEQKPDTYEIVDQRIRAELALCSGPSERHNKQVQTAVHMSTLVYYQSNVDVQVHIAMYTALLLFIDDFHLPQAATEEFLPRLLRGSSQLHPLLDAIVDNLRRMTDYFPQQAARGISSSALNFVNRTIFDTERADHVLSQSAVRYVEWTRIKDGIGAAYAFFIWDKFQFSDIALYVQAIPDIEVILDYINDIFSFYKEESTGDCENMIHRRAAVKGQHVLEALSDIVEEVLLAVGRVRALLQGKERNTWELFLARYIAFHCYAPRYRLSEIISF